MSILSCQREERTIIGFSRLPQSVLMVLQVPVVAAKALRPHDVVLTPVLSGHGCAGSLVNTAGAVLVVRHGDSEQLRFHVAIRPPICRLPRQALQ